MTDQSDVFIFWDNSNIYISAQNVAEEKETIFDRKAVRIHFKNLYTIASRSRNVRGVWIGGSIPPEHEQVWKRFENELGHKIGSDFISLDLQERGAQTNTEQGVDASLQLEMMNIIHDKNPGTIVLLTGDGRGYRQGKGFHATLERAKEKKWKVEVISWKISCNKNLREWANKEGLFVGLEDYYGQITFLQNSRNATKPNLTHLPN